MTSRSHTLGKGRRAALAALAVSSFVVLAACGSDPKPAAGSSDTDSGSDETKTLVFSPLALKIPAMQQLSEGVKHYAEEQGYDVIVQDPNLDPQKQVTDLQTAIESGKADAVWAIMVAPDAAKALLPAAQAKGVPMVVNGTPEAYGMDGMQPGISFATIDYKAQGEAAGTELGNCINERYDGKAKVLFAESTAGTAGKEEYEGAVKETLAATAPDAEIVTTITVTDRQAAQTDVGNALQGNPDITAVFAQNDEGALGTVGAFKAAGKDVPCITETGGNEETLAAVESGDLYAVVALQFADDMTQNVDKLTEMLDDPDAEGVQLVTPQKVVKAES
ncbi:substrate-binding domain-containing protein [Nocardioides sp. MAH-18]|uniref:Substrate-binding domain-containing protein n=1 Tax=Nocardioides agri TaxID=2682843 RepID=A0A6L6XXC3_9ACTN|nr:MULTISPECIES: sugar ABC transporter substrate-binding protein [unclassified Nocardioides]MBA2955304.1 sugar ABC transporter substrate-binding protein [Nocardioides sp. CGMCC 1.13656]MVQ50155.1 substrate-binding domain-containing protein [Nocardioides sp. MAH-18]